MVNKNENTILIYSSSLTSRLQYTISFIFGNILGLSAEIITDSEQFTNSHQAKINYSDLKFSNEIFIKPHTILFEKTIKHQEVSYHEFYNLHGIFLTDPNSDMPFDPFAATFYMITRYEEYIDKDRDVHDRFEAHHSIATKYNFLKEPVVEQWAFAIAKLIQEKYNFIDIPRKEFRHVSTFDIDQAFSFKYKGAFRIAGGSVRSLIRFQFQEFIDRFLVLTDLKRDPFDNFEFIRNIHQKYHIKPYFFFLFGRYGRYDKNISPTKIKFQELVKKVSEHGVIGIHPSYTSNFDLLQLKEEVKKLSIISDKWIQNSRQHFLRLSLPKTYTQLLKAGIKNDFTMGYSTNIGFRAGTCTPYKFFNLETNEETNLTIWPFQIMDTTLLALYHKPERAIEEVEKIILKIQAVNGTYISLWHNESLGNYQHWKNWRQVFIKMMKMIYDAE